MSNPKKEKYLERLYQQREQLQDRLDQVNAEIMNLNNPVSVDMTEEELEAELGYPVNIIKKTP
jgi:DNA polymerase III delta prime subunit